jgi:hypothetical protein
MSSRCAPRLRAPCAGARQVRSQAWDTADRPIDEPVSFIWRTTPVIGTIRLIEEDGRWQVNSGHRDFGEVTESPALKRRHLVMPFAKEIVLRSHQDPRLKKPLEQTVELTLIRQSL